MRRHTSVRLLTTVTAATVLALTGCEAAGTVRSAEVPVGMADSITPGSDVAGSDAVTESTSSAEPEPDGAGVCGPDQVRATVTELKPAADDRSLLLSLYSVSTTDCALTNPPIMGLLGPDGTNLPSAVEPGDLPDYRPGPAERIPAGLGVTVVVGWRTEPGTPAADCMRASALRVRLTDDAPPIDVPVQLTACDGGALLVEPYDITAG